MSSSASGVVPNIRNTHGKGIVRVGKVRRAGDVHHFAEYTVQLTLEGGADSSFTQADNSVIVPTDTMKNTVYAIAKEHPCDCPENFGIALVNHFMQSFAHLTAVRILVKEHLWDRLLVNQKPHNTGFLRRAPEIRTADVYGDKTGKVVVVSGISNLVVLKTTQSGFENFHQSKYTSLPPTNDRILSTSITASWSYPAGARVDYVKVAEKVRQALLDEFYGPPDRGVYSISVQATMYDMGKAVLQRISEVSDIHLEMPNIHYLPYDNPKIGVKFEKDIFIATNEPHGMIECSFRRPGVARPASDPTPLGLRAKL